MISRIGLRRIRLRRGHRGRPAIPAGRQKNDSKAISWRFRSIFLHSWRTAPTSARIRDAVSAGGMAGSRRPRGLLPAGRLLRHDRPHLQPHHRARARAAASYPHQPLRSAVQGDHRLQPGQDRPRGRGDLEAGHRLLRQQGRLCDPRRDPPRAQGRQLRAAHAHARRHGGRRDEMRPAADQSRPRSASKATSATTTTRARRSSSPSASAW